MSPDEVTPHSPARWVSQNNRYDPTGASCSMTGGSASQSFSYGSAHWFHPELVSWAVAHQVTAAAVTDGLIAIAVVMVLVRTISLAVRASHLRTPALTPQNA